MSDIFVCYASEDLERVHPLVAALQEHGWTVWWDVELVAGPSFDKEIEKALDAASCVVVVWSSYSIESRWVRTEANEGLERDILVPLLIDDVRPPLAFRIAQTAQMFGWPQEKGQLNDVIDGISKLIGETTADQAEREKSIAVLPFINMSSDPEQEFFSDGISEDILNALVKNPSFNMIARSSSFQFKGKNHDIKEIGAQLNASHILEGSVRKMGTRIRVTAQLNKTSDGTRVWSDQYDRELTDVFEVQDEITQNICQALHTELFVSPNFAQPTKNVDAHNAYLLGRFHNGRDEHEQAIQHLEKAIALDSNYADAYSALAIVHSNVAGLGFAPYGEKLPLIRELSDKALTINPVHILARDVNTQIRFYVEYDYQGAIDASTKLIREDRRLLNNYGNQLSTIGQFDLAMRVFDQALKRDPLSPLVLESRGFTLLSAGRFDEAHAAFQMRESLGVASTEHLALLARIQGDIPGIRKQLNRDRQDWRTNNSYALFEAAIPYLEGDHEQVISKLSSLKQATGYQNYYTKLQSACLERDVDLAMSCFEQGIMDSDRMMLGLVCRIKADPLYSELPSQPKFQSIVRQVGLDDISIAKLRIPPLPF